MFIRCSSMSWETEWVTKVLSLKGLKEKCWGNEVKNHQKMPAILLIDPFLSLVSAVSNFKNIYIHCRPQIDNYRQQWLGWSRSIKIYEMESFKVASESFTAHTCCDCWRGCQLMNQSQISRQFELPLLLLIRPSNILSAHALLSASNWR